MRRNDWIVLFALAFVWGSAFPLTGYLLKSLAPLWISFLRIAIAGIGIAIVALLFNRDLRPTLRAWRILLALGLFNNALPFTLLAWGQSRIDSGLAAIINASTPIWSALLGAAIGAAEGLTGRRWAGVALGFVGVAILVGPSAWFGVSDLWGEIACLGAACSYATAGMIGRKLKGVAPLNASAAQLLFSTVLMIPVVWIAAPPLPTVWDVDLIGATLALALGSTAISYILYFHLLARIGPTRTLMVTYLVPAVAIVLAIPLLGQQPTWLMIAAFAVILAGVALASRRPQQAAAQPSSPEAPRT